MLASFILCSRPYVISCALGLLPVTESLFRWTIFRTLHMKLPLFGLFMLALGQTTLVILRMCLAFFVYVS